MQRKCAPQSKSAHKARATRVLRCAVESLETRRLLSGTAQSLFPVRQYAGTDPTTIAVADLNGDGRTDMVVANTSADTITVMLSNSNGTYSSTSYALAGDPQSVAIGDMNGDGKPDIVVATTTPYGGAAADNISILLGNGHGAFGAPTNYSLTSAPTSIALADLNGDGHLDVVAACGWAVAITLNTGTGALGTPSYDQINNGEADQIATGNITGHGRPDVVVADEADDIIYVLPDQSNGSLAPPQTYTLTSYIGDIAVTDVNGDGKVDVVTASDVLFGTGTALAAPVSNGLAGGYPFVLGDFNGDGSPDIASISPSNGGEYVQLNNGHGTFAPPILVGTVNSMQPETSAIVAGDFNGDGKLDTATSNPDSGAISIQLGSGNGTLASAGQQIFVGGVPNAIVSADFSGDGHLDLVTANGQSDGLGDTITVLTNNGSGSFPIFTTYTVGNDPRALVVGDFNGDGKPDLAVANYADNTVSILLNLGNGEFAPAQNYAVGHGPVALAVGDFNGDGRQDLVVADADSPEVDLLLNKGGGAFLTAIPYTLNDDPDSVAVGDFNGDGHLDIATASYTGEDVEVLTNNGLGGFGPVVSYPLGAGASSIVAANLNNDSKSDLAVITAYSGVDELLANSSGFSTATSIYTGPSSALTVGDLNGDSKPDLLITQASSAYDGSLTVLLGNGNGTFATPISYSSSSPAQAATIGDFNGDGHADVAIATQSYGIGGIAMFFGRGGGVLGAPMLYTAADSDPQAIATGDFNNDGHLDFVTANYEDSTISVYLNNGNGTFAAPTTYSVGSGPTSIAVGDFNDDGLPDIAVANYLDNTVSILINNGEGGFDDPETISVGNGPKYIVAADFNHDHYADLALANTLDDDIQILINNHSGNFNPYAINLNTAPSGLATGDFNDDGYTDLVATSTSANNIYILKNSSGIFTAATNYASTVTLTGGLAVGDLNGDGHSDIIAAAYDSSTYSDAIETFLANANGTLAAPTITDVADSSTLLLADLNGDGKLDLITPASFNSNEIAVSLGTGTGAFGAAQTYDAGIAATALTAGDFDGDGKTDLAIVHASNYGQAAIVIAFGNGAGGLLSASAQNLNASLLSIATGDFDGNGSLDLLTRNSAGYDNSSYSVLLNNNGSFFSSQTFTLPGNPTAEALGDFNGDGILDLAFIEPATGGGQQLLVLLGNGDGTFQSPLIYSAGTGSDADSIAVGDFNGDGLLDLALANAGSGTVTILLNNGTGGFTVGNTLVVGSDPADIVAADFNGDGKTDLAVANEGSDSISILAGNGNGTFAAAQNIAMSDAPTQLVAADFNGDGKTDLTVIGDALGGGSDNHIYVLLNLGNATFATPVSYTLDAAATGLTVGDFNGDSSPDLAVSSYVGDDVQILINNGSGAFAASQDYNVGASPNQIIAGDFNNDQMSDVAVVSFGAVSVLENQYDGIIPHVTANTFSAPSTGAQSLTFTITLSDNIALNINSIHTGTVTVTLPDGSVVQPTFISLSSTNSQTVVATFTLNGPFAEIGTYTLHLAAGGATDTNGKLSAASTIASFLFSNGASVPTAVLQSTTSPTSGQTTFQFAVNFTDSLNGIDNTSFANAISVSNSALDFSAVASVVSATAIANGYQVLYQITAPNGSFTYLDDGTYEILLNANTLANQAGTFAAAQTLGSFSVNLSQSTPPPSDTTPPTASADGFTAPALGDSSITFTVTYSDDTAVNSNTITSNSVSITLPDGNVVYPTLLSVTSPGASITATYSFTPADGSFTVSDNGQYTLNLVAGGFADSSGNLAAAATLSTFTLDLQQTPPPPSDTTPPTAQIISASQPSADTTTMQFTVSYTDNAGGSGVNGSSLGDGNITVTGPNYSANASLVSITPTATGINAVYQIVAPNGFFSQGANGTYIVTLNANAVADYAGNFIASEQLGSFVVSLSPPATAPDITGSVTAPSISVLPGSKKNTYSLTIANTGTAVLNAKVPVVIYASPTPSYDPSTAIQIDSVSEKLKLNNGQSKDFKLSFAAPPSIAGGNYYLIAIADPDNTIAEQYKANNTFISAAPVNFAAPTVDLAVKMSPPAKNGVVKVTITNTSASNELAKGPVNLDLYSSTDDATLDQLLTSATENLSLKVGASKTFSLKVALADLAGDYLAATIAFNGPPADTDTANNTVFSTTLI